MGQLTGNSQTINHAVGCVLFGDNEFESGAITLAASGVVKEGALLKRLDSGKFGLLTTPATETPVAVYIGETITNSTASSADYEIRACISGRVDANKCFYGSDTALTVALKDALRATSIIPLDSKD